MMTRVCKICGKEFTPTHPNNKFCSALCKELNSKNYSKSWRAKNDGYITIYMRSYRARKKRETAQNA